MLINVLESLFLMGFMNFNYKFKLNNIKKYPRKFAQFLIKNHILTGFSGVFLNIV